MEDFLANGGLITVLVLLWLAFLFAVWRAVRIESRDLCAMYARNRAARITARRETIRTWHCNNTPTDVRN
jgi:hypothetical protein